MKQMNKNFSHKKEPNGLQVGVDLTFVEPRLMEISSVITCRYDAGICKHRLERTGVLVVEHDKTDRNNNN